MGSSDASSSVQIDAAPDAVYALVTDLDVLAELAEETARMRWTKGSSAAPGNVFRGTNRNGLRRWTTTCTVTDAEPGRRFAFEVTYGPVPVAHWVYAIEPEGDGCRVTESTFDRRPGWFAAVSGIATGSSDRGAANRGHIEATLRRLKARAER